MARSTPARSNPRPRPPTSFIYAASPVPYCRAVGLTYVPQTGCAQACRVLNNVTWQPLLECQHPASVQGPASVVVYQEAPEDGPHEAATGNGGRSPAKALGPAADQGQGKTKFVICDLPAAVATVKPALDRPGPKLGVGELRRRSTEGPGGLWAASSCCVRRSHYLPVDNPALCFCVSMHV